MPPDDANDTEEDSDQSDEEHEGNINHLPRGVLNQTCEAVGLNENDWDPEDFLPLSVVQKIINTEGNRKSVESYTKSKWVAANVNKPSCTTTCSGKQPSDEAKSASIPIDFFKLFFDNDLMSLIMKESNIYALQKNDELDLTMEELHVFLGVLLLSGYGKYPNKRLYWTNSDDVPKIVQQSIRLKRFEKILKLFHLNDNTKRDPQDRLYKIRPLISKLNNNFKKHGGLDENLSIDESMVPYYGKHYAKQYIRGKPIRFGYKNWAICSNSGYMYGFDIYMGKDATKEKQFGIGGDVVMSLLNKIEVPPNQGYKLYFDNYFTSLRLLTHLAKNNYYATGTIRENRLEKCPVPTKKMWDKEIRGSFKYFSNDTSILVQWKDNKVVSVASNFEGTEIVNTTRWDRISKSKKSVPQPKIIHNYNKGMGGVDKMDSLIAVYRTRIRQRKWYWPLVAYLLDVSVVNSWLLMKKIMPDAPEAESLLSFRRYLALSFLKSFGVKPQPGRVLVTSTLASVRFDNVGHIVVYNEKDRRCGHCGKKANFLCDKCNIALHPKMCFKIYHSR